MLKVTNAPIIANAIIAVLLYSVFSTAHSQDTFTVSSHTDEFSLVTNDPLHHADYNIIDNFGGTNSVHVNVQSGEYWVVTQDFDAFIGTVPQGAQDEYYLEGIPLPCFSGPWAAGGCAVAAGATALYCEIRQRTNLRRAHRQCQLSNAVFHATGFSWCGNVSGYCFGMNPPQVTP